ncbi:hypothetical protein BN2476_2040006 [Paraburkholderia piptadeniae]|uniref:Uncharacterized protein n=1 Tax=Paraburkholderia piptadeniae TaxID=1701573 RepID=A0A1N7SXJ4_9BURK|nr:hypothetical protein BN2476_2040006 [Paraburkholderia piptadeniae]
MRSFSGTADGLAEPFRQNLKGFVMPMLKKLTLLSPSGSVPVALLIPIKPLTRKLFQMKGATVHLCHDR